MGLLRPAEEAIKYLLARRWTLSKARPMELDSLPTKPQMTSIRPKKRRAQSPGGEVEGPYQPKVVDLTKVEMPVELLVSYQFTEYIKSLSILQPLPPTPPSTRLWRRRWQRTLTTNGPRSSRTQTVSLVSVW